MKEISVSLVLNEDCLGSQPGNKEVHSKYVALHSANAEAFAEEQAALPAEELIAKGKTVFYRDASGNPSMMDYQIKGFFKAACEALRRVDDTLSKEQKAYKKIIDTLIFVGPRFLPFSMPAEGTIGERQRPLRAQTPMGERVSLATSETIPAGSTLTFRVKCLRNADMELVREWLAYGEFNGLGQWRNSGAGRFSVTITEA